MAAKTKDLAQARSMRLAVGIHRVHEALIQHAKDLARENDLDPVHLAIVDVLGLRGSVRMGDLARYVVIGAANMTRRASQLEERGLVERRRSPESQREVLIQLTRKGQALFDRCFPELHRAHTAYFDERLNKTEQAQLAQLLEKL